jgi:PST family polysaccharide transporter
MIMPSPHSATRRIASGTAVSYLGFFLGKIIVFLNTVVLARLLLPEHFGLVAIGLLVLAVSETIAEAGTGAAIVWRKGDVITIAPVALAVGLIGAAVTALAAVLLAPTIAAYFNTPEVVPIIRVLALAALVSTPTSVFTAILQARMEFGRRLVTDTSKALTKGLVGIPLAYFGAGAWSIVFGHLAGITVGLLLSWWFSRWKVRLGLQPDIVRQILPYGLQIAAVSILGLAIRRLDVAIIGGQLTTAELGYYTMAFSLIELSIMGLCWSASQAFFPALSGSGQAREETAALFSRGLSFLMAVIFPLAFGLAVLAEPVVLTVLGEKWRGAIAPMQILAFYALIFSIGFNLGDVYKATGRPGILTAINLVNLIIAVPLLLFASAGGLIGVALGQVGIAVVITTVNWIVAYRASGIGPRVLVQSVWAPFIAAGVTSMICLALDRLLLAESGPTLRLILGSVAGLSVYAALFGLLRRDMVDPLLARLGKRRRAIPPSDPN